MANLTTEALAVVQWAEAEQASINAEVESAGLAKPKRISSRQIGLLLRMRDSGVPNTRMAQVLGCDEVTIRYHLEQLADCRTEARAILERGSTKLAETVVNTKNAQTALMALGKLDVVRDTAAAAAPSVLIQFGSAAPSLPDITVSPVLVQGESETAPNP